MARLFQDLRNLLHPQSTDNLLVRIHFIIVMIRWTGLALWEFEFPFPGSLTSTFLTGRTSTSQSRARTTSRPSSKKRPPPRSSSSLLTSNLSKSDQLLTMHRSPLTPPRWWPSIRASCETSWSFRSRKKNTYSHPHPSLVFFLSVYLTSCVFPGRRSREGVCGRARAPDRARHPAAHHPPLLPPLPRPSCTPPPVFLILVDRSRVGDWLIRWS